MATYLLPSSGGYESGTYVRYRIRVVEGTLSGRRRPVSIYVEYWRTNTGYNTNGTGTCYCIINGTTYSQAISSSEHSITYNSMTVLFSKTVYVDYDTNGNASLSIYAYSTNNNSNIESGSNGGTIYLNNIGVGTYTITYKGSSNEDYGFPSAQTGTLGSSIKLSSHTPARPGHSFLAWTLYQDGSGAYYYPGETVYFNEDTYLYAQWTTNAYTITYDANGGSGGPTSQTKNYGVNLTLSSTVPTRSNYTFKGWGTSATSTTASYAPGGLYTTDASITLYAIWESSYVLPKIEGFSVFRSDSNGVHSDTGSSFVIGCTCTVDPSAVPISIEIRWKSTSATKWTTASTTTESANRKLTLKIAAANLSSEDSYDVEITITDNNGYTSTTSGYIPGRSYTIDCNDDGTGVAFGKPAEQSNLLDVAWDSRFRGDMTIDGNVTVEGSLTTTDNIFDKVYPVNSIYLSYSGVSPATLFGGTWERIAPFYLYATGDDSQIGVDYGYAQPLNLCSEQDGSIVYGLKIAAWRRTA